VTPKLVRDRIPELIRATGQQPIVTPAAPADYRALLVAKLREETDELELPICDELEELADIVEVVYALAADLGLSVADVEAMRAAKAAQRGGFGKRLVWHANTDKAGGL
jgi:predicted house-cleaning noncanonical NTP pyrophosphatase (MazG superfamily)